MSNLLIDSKIRTNKVLMNVLQWADIKDPGVALTTLGVTKPSKEA